MPVASGAAFLSPGRRFPYRPRPCTSPNKAPQSSFPAGSPGTQPSRSNECQWSHNPQPAKCYKGTQEASHAEIMHRKRLQNLPAHSDPTSIPRRIRGYCKAGPDRSKAPSTAHMLGGLSPSDHPLVPRAITPAPSKTSKRRQQLVPAERPQTTPCGTGTRSIESIRPWKPCLLDARNGLVHGAWPAANRRAKPFPMYQIAQFYDANGDSYAMYYVRVQ